MKQNLNPIEGGCMEKKQDLSVINCIATAFLAYFFTVPVHELFHAITSLAYGDRILMYSATAVQPASIIDYKSLDAFNRIMVSGGSASILNAVIAIILAAILLRCTMGPALRLFFTQLMGAQFCQGFGYFLIGGFFAAGDWGQVFSYFTDDPGFVSSLRIILSVIGSAGVVMTFFLLNHMSYYFIEDPSDKKEKKSVAFKLHLLMFIIGTAIGVPITLIGPHYASGGLSVGMVILFNFMWIPFFWGFMFTGIMKVMQPVESRFLYKLPEKPDWVLFASGMILMLIDIFVFGPGLFFS